MKTKKEQLFDSLDVTHYKSVVEAKSEYYIFKNQFKDVLGYDNISGGFAALQKGHQPGALLDELPIVSILKNNGYAVILLDETGKDKRVDALINGLMFDFKNLRSATNIFQRIKKDCQSALDKGALNVLIHINLELSLEELITILKRLAHSPQVNRLDKFWCIWEGKLFTFELADFK